MLDKRLKGFQYWLAPDCQICRTENPGCKLPITSHHMIWRPGLATVSRCRCEGFVGGSVDRDWRYHESCHPAGGEAGSHSCRQVNMAVEVNSAALSVDTPPFPSPAGVAAVAIENTEGGHWIKENYKFSHCIPEELQGQIDQKYLNSFKSFDQ